MESPHGYTPLVVGYPVSSLLEAELLPISVG